MKEGGTLKGTCAATEEEVGLGCTGKYCCCAPKDACAPHGHCADGRGSCRTKCQIWEKQQGGCGHHCKCCVPIDNGAIEMEECVKAGGSIKEKCSSIEKEVGPGCSKGHCCCALLDG
ncbi:keratin-associated protein 5-1-like [Scylla paramamosain]|uniref:keratin-associated protein 5-1-like n=1 Tax=Scylla paramamosain TaxID=85552 RepID=UPI00308313B2